MNIEAIHRSIWIPTRPPRKGISYEVGVPVMAFGSQVEKARTLKKGETLKAVCDKREAEGRTSYTLLKIVP